MPTIAAEALARALPLRSPRLVLRPLRPGDAKPVQRLAGEWDVARYTAQIPHPYPDGVAEAWIAEACGDLEAARRINLAIERHADGALIGCVELDPDDPEEGATVGYWIGRPYWGQGYMTEALRCLLRFAFFDLDFTVIRASAAPANVASIRVQEKLGFRLTGSGLEAAPARGGPVEVERRALRREAFADEIPVVLVAAVALVDADGRVLLARRPEGKRMAGLWEFPGGKLRGGETPEAALARELREELGIDVAESCLAPLTFASHRYPDCHLLMPLYVCRIWQGEARPLEGQEIAWVRPARLGDHPMPPADKPLVAMLRDFL